MDNSINLPSNLEVDRVWRDEVVVPECKNLLADLEASICKPSADAYDECTTDVSKHGECSSGIREEDVTILKDETTGPEHIRVYLRIRPLTDDEKSRGMDEGCVIVENNSSVIVAAPRTSHAFRSSMYGLGRQRQRFSFTRVFPDSTLQKQFFDDTVRETVSEFVKGQNCLVFTYGVTNSGKTYTIQGNPQQPEGSGILPRSLDVIFSSIAGHQVPGISFKPIMFGDVARLTAEQSEQERQRKDRLLRSTRMPSGSRENIAEKTTTNAKKLSDATSDHNSETEADLDPEFTAVYKSNISELDGISDDSLELRMSLVQAENAAVERNSEAHVRYSVWASFAEIYNEQIYDLLVPQEAASNCASTRITPLLLRDDKGGRPYIRGLHEVPVSNAEEAQRLLEIGRQNLHIASTRMNRASSRSHCIFTLRLVQVTDISNPSFARVASLSFCDLAGSERYQSTCGFNDRVKEAGNINSSLLTLGRCIDALRRNQAHRGQGTVAPTPQKRHADQSFVAPTPLRRGDLPTVSANPPAQGRKDQLAPFRESKLTRLFQNFLCGEGRVVMIINISQCSNVFDETLHALKYSALARQVVIGPPLLPSFQAHAITAMPAQAAKRKVSLHGKRPASIASSKQIEKKRKTTDLKPQMELEETELESGTDTEVICVEKRDSEATAEDGILSESEESSSESEYDESDTPVASWNDEKQKLLQVVDQLQTALTEEQRSKAKMETRIRDEVCTEMRKQLVQIQNEYQEGLRVREEMAEEKYERKMEIYMEAVQKSYKRQRQTEDDEYVPSVELHSAKVKIAQYADTVRDLEGRIHDMEKELSEVRDSFKKVSNERDSLAERTTKAEFFASDIEKKLECLQSAAAVSPVSAESEEMMERLKRKVEQLEAELAVSASKGDSESRGKIEELMSKIDDMEHRHEMACRHLRREKGILEQKLNAAEKLLAEQSSVGSVNVDVMESLKEAKLARAELESKLNEAQESIHNLEADLSQAVETAKKAASGFNEQIREVETLRDEKGTELAQLRALCDKMEVDMQKQMKLAAEAKKGLAESEKARLAVENELSEVQSASKDSRSRAELLSCELETLKSNLEAVKVKLAGADEAFSQKTSECSELKQINSDTAEKLSTLECSIESLNLQLMDARETLSQKTKECEELKEKYEEMTKKSASAEHDRIQLSDLEKNLASTKEMLKNAEEAESHSAESLKARLSEAKSELDKLRADISAKNSKIEQLEKELNEECGKVLQLEKAESDLAKKLQDVEEQLGNEKKVSKETASLQAELLDAKNNLSSAEEARKEAESEVKTHVSALESCRKHLNLVQDEMKVMTKQVSKGDEREKSLKAELANSIKLCSELQEKVSKMAADCEQAEAHRLALEGLREDLSRARNEHTAKVKQLESELTEKEQKLHGRYSTIDELIKQMEKERDSYEVALKDARSNEAVIERLRLTVTEQETTMQLQDKTLHDRDLEISALQDSVRRLRSDHDSQVSESNSELNRREQELTRQLAAAQELERQKELRVRELEKEARKLEKSKQCLEKDVIDTTSELKVCEHKLAEKERELVSARQEVEHLKTSDMSAKEVAKEMIQRKAEVAAFREQLKASEERCLALEKELIEARERIKSVEENKQKELAGFRNDRDSIVASLEKLIAEKDAKIAEKDAVIAARDAEIKQLKKQLSKATTDATNKRKAAKEAADTENETVVAAAKEVENLNRKLTMMQKDLEQLEITIKIKDQTIADVREQHLQLQHQLTIGSTEEIRPARKSRVPTTKSRVPLRTTDHNAVADGTFDSTLLDETAVNTPRKKTSRKTQAVMVIPESPAVENAHPEKSSAAGRRKRQTSVAASSEETSSAYEGDDNNGPITSTAPVRQLRSRRII